MASLAEGKSGQQKYDFILPTATYLYRCPLVGYVNPHNNKPMDIDSHGLQMHMQCLVDCDSPDVDREAHLRMIPRGGKAQHHVTK